MENKYLILYILKLFYRKFLYSFFPRRNSTPVGQYLFIIDHSRSQTHHTRQDSSGRVIIPAQRSLPNNTQHAQEKDIHTVGGILTHNPSKRAAVDPRLRPTATGITHKYNSDYTILYQDKYFIWRRQDGAETCSKCKWKNVHNKLCICLQNVLVVINL